MTTDTKEHVAIGVENLHLWGFVPTFLKLDDPRSAREQLAANYIAGWHPMKGWTIQLDADGHITAAYGDPDDEFADPPLRSIARLYFRDEVLYLLPHEWVVLKNGDQWEIDRLD